MYGLVETARICRQVALNAMWGLAGNAMTGWRTRRDQRDYVANAHRQFEYCQGVLESYLSFAGITDWQSYLPGRRILEIGPGHSLFTGLWSLAMGAAQYVAVERFHWDNRPEFRRQIVQYLLDSLQPAQRARIDGVWQTYVEDPLKSKDGPLQYVVMPFEDFPGTGGPFDVIWSRVVLQSVLDLDAVFGKIAQCLCPDGLSIHKTDLGHEGHSHSGHPLSFLSYSPRLWRAMYSHRDSLNRLRKSDYFAAAQRAGMEMARVEVTRELDPSIVEAIRPRLLPAFRTKDTADLACQGLLLAMRHKSARMSPK